MKFEKLILIIFDHGKPERSIRLEYQINIIDLNDSPPRFNQPLKCHLDLDRAQNRSKYFDEPLFQVQAIDLDLGDNGLVSYSILPPYENLFMINTHGEIFNMEYLNESSYHLQIMAIDHGKTIQLNSTYDCYISISTENNNRGYLNKSIKITIFKYKLFININIDHIFKPNKTYHLYVSIPRKSLYINDQSPRDNASEECVHLNSDQSSEKDSLSSHHQFSRTVHHSYPSNVNSTKSSHDSSVVLSKQDSRPVSLSISTATTCTSTGTDSLNNSNSTVIQLAEGEKIDV